MFVPQIPPPLLSPNSLPPILSPHSPPLSLIVFSFSFFPPYPCYPLF